MSDTAAFKSYQTYKTHNYETRTIRLDSPMLHIGLEVSSLNPFEYVQTASKVYFPNTEALAQAFYHQGGRFLQDYVNAIEEKRSIEPLLEQAFGDDWQNAKSPDGQKIFPQVRSKWTLEEGERITDLRPMIRNGMGDLYVPGSSIKGAIRTAIAYFLLKYDKKYKPPQPLSEVERKIRQGIASGEFKSRFNQKWADDGLFMDDIFTNCSLSYQGRSVKARNGPNTDFMRAISVSDSQPLRRKTIKLKSGKQAKKNIPVVAEVIVSSHFQDQNAKYRASIYTEMVRNVRTEFTITLDREMLSWFKHNSNMQIPFETVEDLLRICKDFAQDQWKNEANYWSEINNNYHQGKNLDFNVLWDKFYSNPTCPYDLRIGWGTGLFGTTISGLLDDDLRSQLRDICGIKAPGFQAPKSRRTIVSSRNEIVYVPGWVKFTPR